MTEPGGLLGAILARKRADVASRLSGVRLEELRGWAEPTRRSLRAALAAPGARFILEVKRVSVAGALRNSVDPRRRPLAMRRRRASASYRRAFFGGSLDDLLRSAGL